MTAVRKNIVFATLVVLLAVLVVGLVLRGRTEHVAPGVPAPSASASGAKKPAPSGKVAQSSSAAPLRTKPKGLGRVLRVTGLGWELLAPALLENGGLTTKKDSAFSKADLQVAISPADTMKDVEGALARGGADSAGADVAVVPLPNLAMAYDRLRALRPAVFFVSGWSRGREVLAAKEPLDRVPTTGDVLVESKGSDSSLAFALFSLDLSGIAPGRVKLAEPGDKAKIRALDGDDVKPGDQTNVVLSTAEAGRFVPFVMVAPASFVDRERTTLAAFCKAWLAGVEKMDSDPTGSARSIGALEGAPEPIALLGRLGRIAPTGLAENAELTGLSGRGAVTIETLFLRTWRLVKDAKLSTASAPEAAPVAPIIVATLVRSEPKLAKPIAKSDAPSEKPKHADALSPLVVTRIDGDTDEVAHEAALVTGVFPRAQARITAYRGGAMDKALATELVNELVGRYGLGADRFTIGKVAPRPHTAAALEILRIP